VSGEGIPESFWDRLRRSGRRALLLDYDGTLAPFQVDRDRACPYPGVRQVLDAILSEGRCRLVVVSGRPAEDVVSLLGLSRAPEVWGCHGWERLLPEVGLQRGDLPEPATRALKQARAWAEERGYGERCEVKPVTVAFHWRGLDAGVVAALRAEVSGVWGPLAKRGGLELHPFDGGLELRCSGRDKGYAVRRVLAELGANAAVAYLGDDLTDEDAFVALRGRGLGVLVRDEPRSTAAEAHLAPPGELLEFLENWRDVCRENELE